eukprot:3775018-Rhodomonas_salina.1
MARENLKVSAAWTEPGSRAASLCHDAVSEHSGCYPASQAWARARASASDPHWHPAIMVCMCDTERNGTWMGSIGTRHSRSSSRHDPTSRIRNWSRLNSGPSAPLPFKLRLAGPSSLTRLGANPTPAAPSPSLPAPAPPAPPPVFVLLLLRSPERTRLRICSLLLLFASSSTRSTVSNLRAVRYLSTGQRVGR